MVFQTSRNWTSDCNVTTNWSGRFVSPTTVVARGSATFAGRSVEQAGETVTAAFADRAPDKARLAGAIKAAYAEAP